MHLKYAFSSRNLLKDYFIFYDHLHVSSLPYILRAHVGLLYSPCMHSPLSGVGSVLSFLSIQLVILFLYHGWGYFLLPISCTDFLLEGDEIAPFRNTLLISHSVHGQYQFGFLS